MRQRGTNNNEHCNLIQVVLDPDLIKVQLEWHLRAYQNTCLCKLSWNPLQWTWHDLYTGQGSKGIPFFQFTTRLGRHILVAQTDKEPVVAKIWHTYHIPWHNYYQVLVTIVNTTTHCRRNPRIRVILGGTTGVLD